MLASIIVPVRWSGPEHAHLFAALAGQQLPGPCEIIAVIADDGRGRDGRGDFPAAWPATVKVVRVEPATPGNSRNAGAKTATGEFLVFIDDDCRPEPRWLEQLLTAAQDPAIGAVAGGVLPAPASTLTGKYLGAYGLPLPEDAAVYDRVIPFVSFGHSANLLVRRAMFNELGGFEAGWPTGEDHDFCYRLIKAGHKLAFVPAAAVRHHHRATVRGMLRQAYGYGRGQIRLFRRHWPQYSIEFWPGQPTRLYRSLGTCWAEHFTVCTKALLFLFAFVWVAALDPTSLIAIFLLLLIWWSRLANQLARRVIASGIALTVAEKLLLPILHIAREFALGLGQRRQGLVDLVLVI